MKEKGDMPLMPFLPKLLASSIKEIALHRTDRKGCFGAWNSVHRILDNREQREEKFQKSLRTNLLQKKIEKYESKHSCWRNSFSKTDHEVEETVI